MKTKPTIPLYWKCQVIGWSVTSLYWIVSGWTDDFDLTLTAAQFITDVLLYILITHLFRNFSKKHNWHNLPFRQLMVRLVPSVLVLAVAYNVLTLSKLYIVHSAFNPLFSPTFYEYYSYYALAVFMAGLRLMAIWLLFYYLYHYAQREIRIARENASLAVIAKDAQLNNLSSQLNPHFLFNSLNTIKGLVHADPDQASRSIDLLSDLLRNALYKTDTLWTTLEDEIALVKDYLELQKIRFEERLNFSVEVPEELLQVSIVPFSVQTLVENAVKHGISKQIDGGKIIVRAYKDADGFITIAVQNPGKLEMDGTSPGIGLVNLKERLQMQFSQKANLCIKEEANNTVLATILIPAA